MRAALAGAILAFWPGLLEPFAPVKAAFVRLAGLSLAVWIATEALTGRLPRGGAPAAAALAWALVYALATWASIDPRLSWWGEPGQREGLFTALALVGLHLGAARAHRDASEVRGTLRVIVACALLAAGYAQLQLAGLDPIPWRGEPTFTAGGVTALRASGPLGNPILLGAVLAAALPLALARLAERDADAARWVPAAALLTASALLTLSRGTWLAAGLGAGAAVTLALLARADARRVAWTALASLAPALLLGALRAGAPLAARLAEGPGSASGAARAEYAQASLALWAGRPWLGVGPDAFALAFPGVQSPSFWRDEWLGVPLHAHSVPLQTLATVGALGLVAGALWSGVVAWQWRRAWQECPGERTLLAGLGGALLALLAAGAVNAVGLGGAALAAVLAALPASLGAPRAPAGAARHETRALLAAALVALVTLVAAARELAGSAHALPLRDPRGPGDLTPREWRAVTGARARAMERATRAWPHDDLLWRLAAQASLGAAEAANDHTSHAREQAAERAARTAVRLAPRRAGSHLALADALAAIARRTGSESLADSADAAYARACALAPADGWLLVARARHWLARGSGVQALEQAQRITELYPDAASGHALAGAALLLLGRDAEARGELERARSGRWEADAAGQRESLERLLRSPRLQRTAAPPDSRRGTRPRDH